MVWRPNPDMVRFWADHSSMYPGSCRRLQKSQRSHHTTHSYCQYRIGNSHVHMCTVQLYIDVTGGPVKDKVRDAPPPDYCTQLEHISALST